MKKSSLRIVLAVAMMMVLPQISHAQSALLGTLKNAASAALANSSRIHIILLNLNSSFWTIKKLALCFGLVQVHLQLHIGEDTECRFLLRGSLAALQFDPPLQEGAADLILHVLLEPAHAEALDVLLRVLLRVGDYGISRTKHMFLTYIPG